MLNIKLPFPKLPYLKESQLQTASWRGCFLAANAMYLANNIEEAFKILEASEILLEKKTIDAASKENPPTKDVWTSSCIHFLGTDFESELGFSPWKYCLLNNLVVTKCIFYFSG